MTTLEELDPKHASDAMYLLLRLRLEHSSRCEQGETFAISPFAMARDGVIEGWTCERDQNARDVLLQAGLISRESEYVRGYKTGVPARYLLTSSGRARAGSTRRVVIRKQTGGHFKGRFEYAFG